MVFVISDIHGEDDKFIQILDNINFSSSDTMYVLGDCIDRGKHTIKVLFEMMKHPNIYGIVGDHELIWRLSVYVF